MAENSAAAAAQSITDWGRMQHATVRSVVRPASEAELRDVVRSAAASRLKVSQRGIGHSAGGQSFCPDGIMIDMRGLDRILELAPDRRTVRVQTGASWAILTKALEPLGLAVTTKQEFDTFTIGGSIAANVHGKSIDYGPLIDAIESFRLVRPDGDILTVSRESDAELFRAAIGGHGLFGPMVDVTLRLVPDRLVEKSEIVFMNLEPLLASYVERIDRDRKSVPLCYGFLDPACERGFYLTYTYSAQQPAGNLDKYPRDEMKPILFDLFVLLQRTFSFVRRRALHVLWTGSDHPELTLRSRRLLLWDKAPSAFQNVLLQKYFVPAPKFAAFLKKAGAIFTRYQDDLPVMANHFRFVPASSESLMAFAPEDSICLIPFYLAKKDDKAWQGKLERATGELLDACLEYGGRYYLTFDIIASKDQFRRAYPQSSEFFALKRKYDPDEMFSSVFYQKYAR
jgi:decaprenylphospho-beta-D-ribofuranose 2-oxidase